MHLHGEVDQKALYINHLKFRTKQKKKFCKYFSHLNRPLIEKNHLNSRGVLLLLFEKFPHLFMCVCVKKREEIIVLESNLFDDESSIDDFYQMIFKKKTISFEIFLIMKGFRQADSRLEYSRMVYTDLSTK